MDENVRQSCLFFTNTWSFPTHHAALAADTTLTNLFKERKALRKRLDRGIWYLGSWNVEGSGVLVFLCCNCVLGIKKVLLKMTEVVHQHGGTALEGQDRETLIDLAFQKIEDSLSQSHGPSVDFETWHPRARH